MGEEAAVATRSELGASAVELLRRLIRIDTSNPPGSEREAQEMLHAVLAEAGFDCELPARVPERPNLVARLRGEGEGPVLCLLGHADTVPADPSEWSRDPWSGDLASGEVWGRGALDMKGQVATEVAAVAELASDGWRPERGDLLVVITADEEKGGDFGARWLCEKHPGLVRADMVVNEGAGIALEPDGRRLYTASVGEKGICRFTLRTRGRAGHGSLPRVGDNALVKIAPLIERLAEQPPYEPTPEGMEFLRAMLEEPVGEDDEALAEAVRRVAEKDPATAAFLAEPMLGVTLSPVIARAGVKENVIPSRAEVLVDCRVPPELGPDHVRERVGALLGEGDWELEFEETVVGNRSAPGTPLWDAIERWLAEIDPGARLVPVVMAGFSDSNWFRAAFGATVYGFCPHRARALKDTAPLIHGADERVPAEDLELAAGFFRELPRRVLG
jgi:acetylornithine deacetylase/succinyl-diaminopimelate desuccinylase-like protein